MILLLLGFIILTESFISRKVLPSNNIFLRARIINDDENKFNNMEIHLNNELNRLLEIIPIFPEKEDEIKQDSMEGYWRDEFKKICDEDKKINFETYYLWRKEKGTFLEKDDILQVFNSIVNKYDECNLMEFIKITRSIDDDYEF